MPVGAVISAIGGALNLNEQSNQRKFAREFYDRQYRDNIELWNMQNAYNHPQQQMLRLKQAGLNPALMYGQGQKTSSGVADKLSLPSADSQAFSPIDIGNAVTDTIHQWYQIEAQKAQVDKLKQEKELLVQEELKKSFEARELSMKIDHWLEPADQKYGKKPNYFQKLMDTQLDALINKSIRDKAGAALNAQQIRQSKQQILNLITEKEYKELEMTLMSFGLHPKNPMFWKIAGMGAAGRMKHVGKTAKKIKQPQNLKTIYEKARARTRQGLNRHGIDF